ncbi:MAG TPA: hypothetical protein PKL17_13690 [Pseudomonadota bacterium]|jgi:hypothetical protein|nr:hypothetical protein [Pseudomonadota bacterium]HNK45835.1 hypothetical protein [Pseudomonadota bacterium]HNN52024.1 hypothetical protein [Pseudomonadota bacterium]
MPAVELLSCLHRLDLSSHSAVPFGRPGLLLALLGEPGTAHAGLAELLIELKAESLVASHLALSSTNLLSGLVASCLGDTPVGATVVLPSALCVGDPTGIRLLGDAGHHHLLGIWADRQADARLRAQAHHVPLWPLGRTTGQELLIRLSEGPQAEPFPVVLRASFSQLQAEVVRR